MTAASHRDSSAASIASHPQFQQLKQTVIATTGLQYYVGKDDILAERVEARRSALGCTPIDYLNRALDPSDPEELAALVDELTVGETYFFRYPQQFDALRRVVLPACMTNRPRDQPLRIWSAGCASGAEAYSVAILLRRDFAEMLAGRRFAILGTDINRKAVAAAQAGLYSNWDLRATSDDQKRKWFDEVGPNWSLRPEFRKGVDFAHQNLVTDIDAFASAHAGAFDIIFCRNVMIYFGAELMRHLLHRFSECLVDGGWLFVGHAEPYFEIANFLAPVPAAGAAVYRKLHPGSTANLQSETAILPRPWFDEAPLEGCDSYPLPAMGTVTPAHGNASELALAPPLEASSTLPIAAVDVIRRHSDSGKWAAAMQACDQALHRQPLDAALHYAQALIYEHVGTEAAAERALRQAIYLDRGFALAHYHLGRSLTARGDYKSAARSFANASKIVAGRTDSDVLAMGDGLTVAELRDLIRIHLELLERRQ